jgi:hypothetical protein
VASLPIFRQAIIVVQVEFFIMSPLDIPMHDPIIF